MNAEWMIGLVAPETLECATFFFTDFSSPSWKIVKGGGVRGWVGPDCNTAEWRECKYFLLGMTPADAEDEQRQPASGITMSWSGAAAPKT